MNIHQRQGTAKYFYDISKGIALVAVLGAMVQEEWSIFRIINGIAGTIIFFTFAYLLEGGIKDE